MRHGRANQLRGLLLHPRQHAGRVIVPRYECALARAHIPAPHAHALPGKLPPLASPRGRHLEHLVSLQLAAPPRNQGHSHYHKLEPTNLG